MAEWVDWVALYDLEAKERKQAEAEAAKRSKAKGGGRQPRTMAAARSGDDGGA